MGDRRNTVIKYANGQAVSFYTHSTGYRMADDVASALERGRSRWTDDPYLARIVFAQLIKDSVLETTGFGIEPGEAGEEAYPNIVLDCKTQRVCIEGVFDGTFAEFVTASKTPEPGVEPG